MPYAKKEIGKIREKVPPAGGEPGGGWVIKGLIINAVEGCGRPTTGYSEA
jgi:hypothetical protein